ncbi:hypothetical protein ACN9UT_12895 [Staphylococcus caprae]|uniref:hypothetical protein n=1 Tax=Bacillota TaxID=1239 RepID=UPI000CB68570|nr:MULTISPECIES: hypothetical protein [Staphylococcus]MBN6854212.1 hypothetical protein [Staphylococcus warneri]MCC9117578.1 hypothetical protein [Staphylococcus capitis]MCC9143920.1 hypothetical protein [Staphylococcus capitis]PMB94522.1 hypothetical protein CJ234_12385 [Staphylococcus sp. UMB0328]
MKILESLGTIFGIGIVIFPLLALGFAISELTKDGDKSFVLPVIFMILFICSGFGLVIVANIID